MSNSQSEFARCLPSLGAAQPGAVSDLSRFLLSHWEVTIPVMKKKLEQDGLQEITWREAQEGVGHIVAMRIRYKGDFHFLRRENNGLWTHKPGDMLPKDYVGLNEKIRDPRRWPDHSYPQFVGFFRMPEDGIDYLPNFRLQI